MRQVRIGNRMIQVATDHIDMLSPQGHIALGEVLMFLHENKIPPTRETGAKLLVQAAKLKTESPCGLTCDNCVAFHSAIEALAADLTETLDGYGVDDLRMAGDSPAEPKLAQSSRSTAPMFLAPPSKQVH